MAAMNVTDGTVRPKIITRNDSATFIEFCTEQAASVDSSQKIYLILDNRSSRTSKQTRQWLAAHPRISDLRTHPRQLAEHDRTVLLRPDPRDAPLW
jgi:hypothetical protein